MNTVLVTGGAGFIGVPTVRRLLDAGSEVVVFDNFSLATSERLAHLTSSRLTIESGDIRDADAVASAMHHARPFGVVHLAALHFLPYCRAHPAETVAVNVGGLQHVLDAAAHEGVKRLVFASTADVYAPADTAHRETDPTGPSSVYGASKIMGEWLIDLWRRAGSPTVPVIARLFNVAGPGETNPHLLPEICASLKLGDNLRLGNRQTRRDFVYVEDVAHALVRLLFSDLADVTINVGTGRSWNANEVVARISSLTGRALTIETDPLKLRATDRHDLRADTTMMRKLLGIVAADLDEVLRVLLVSEGLLP